MLGGKSVEFDDLGCRSVGFEDGGVDVLVGSRLCESVISEGF